MPITESEILNTTPPFKIVADCIRGPRKGLPKKERPSTVIGYSENDPLGAGGGILPSNPTVYFENGGWLLLSDLLRYHTIVSDV